MKPRMSGTISGCVVWLIVFAVLGMCMIPVAMAVGGLTSGTQLAVRTVAPLVCPEGTSGRPYSYETTMINDNGVRVPATATELHCVDASGETVKKDPVLFAFIWQGVSAGAAVVVMAALAFLLAGPAAVLASRLFRPQSRG